jgi:NADH:ubiquinone oxidoreductase subunit 6 (subunit J)
MSRRTLITAIKAKLGGEFVRVATNLVIGVVGLVIIRFIAQGLPMFQDAGWIVEEKLTVVAGAVMVVDALLLSVLVRFAIELRAYLLGRFAEVPGLANIATSLVFLFAVSIAYIDFKPVTRAWPATEQLYLWSFFALAAILLIGIVVLLYRDRDSMAARVLGQPIAAGRSD